MRNGDIEALIEAFQDSDFSVRVQAGFTVGTMGEVAVAAVPVLIEMLKFGDVEDRKLAATVLGLIGPGAADAIPELLEAADYDQDDVVAKLAMSALGRVEVAEQVELRQAA